MIWHLNIQSKTLWFDWEKYLIVRDRLRKLAPEDICWPSFQLSDTFFLVTPTNKRQVISCMQPFSHSNASLTPSVPPNFQGWTEEAVNLGQVTLAIEGNIFCSKTTLRRANSKSTTGPNVLILLEDSDKVTQTVQRGPNLIFFWFLLGHLCKLLLQA